MQCTDGKLARLTDPRFADDQDFVGALHCFFEAAGLLPLADGRSHDMQSNHNRERSNRTGDFTRSKSIVSLRELCHPF